MVMIRCTAYLCWVLGFLFFTFPYFYFLSYFYEFYICISIFEFGFSYHSLERAISALLCWDFPLFCFSTTFINHSGIRNDGKGCIPAKKEKLFAHRINLGLEMRKNYMFLKRRQRQWCTGGVCIDRTLNFRTTITVSCTVLQATVLQCTVPQCIVP